MKKLLIITYYWPPSGGAGVFRWLKLVKYLKKYGWNCTIITTKNGDYPAIDYSLLSEIDSETKIIRTKTPVFSKFLKKIFKKDEKIPYGSMKSSSSDSLMKKIVLWLRINLIIPDARFIWNRYAYKTAKFEIQTNIFDYIITTGPPHSTHLIGMKLKKELNIKWIADFRDPWTKIPYYTSVKRWFLAQYFDKHLEDKVIRNCDIITAVNEKIISDFKIHPYSFVVTNGFDEEDFSHIKKEKIDKFIISHFGQLTVETDILFLQDIALKLIDEGCQKISFCFWGNIDKKFIAEIREKDLQNVFYFYDYLSHSEMLQKLVNSSLLLLVIDGLRIGTTPLKFFEYLASGTQILCLGPKDNQPTRIIYETETGEVFSKAEKKEIIAFIKAKYKDWEAGKEIRNYSNKIAEYSWESRAKQYNKILKNL